MLFAHVTCFSKEWWLRCLTANYNIKLVVNIGQKLIHNQHLWIAIDIFISEGFYSKGYRIIISMAISKLSLSI